MVCSQPWLKKQSDSVQNPSTGFGGNYSGDISLVESSRCQLFTNTEAAKYFTKYLIVGYFARDVTKVVVG